MAQKTKKFVDDYKGPADKVSSIVVKCIKNPENDGYKAFIALHRKSPDVYGLGVKEIDPEHHVIQFHELHVNDNHVNDNHLSEPESEHEPEPGSETMNPLEKNTSPSHGYSTMAKFLEQNFGLDMTDKFDRSFSINKINVWIHLMQKKIKDSEDLRFVSLSDIIKMKCKEIKTELGSEPSYCINFLDSNYHKGVCKIDSETIVIIKHAYYMGLLAWATDSMACLSLFMID